MIRTTIWVVFFAIIFDVAINILFPIPYPRERGAQLANYFEYGRSVESKVLRLVADNDDNAHILAKIGWFKSMEDSPWESDERRPGRNVYVYGMSFSNHIGKILSEIDTSLNVKTFHGPGAPLNHSYAYYEAIGPHEEGDIVILGILASSLPLMNAYTIMTSSFESPSPFFFPRYRIDANNQIVKDEFAIKSLPELRNVIEDDEAWDSVKKALGEKDSFYDPIIFGKNVLDHSVYVRLLRRAWSQRSVARSFNRYHDQNGFKNEDRLIELAQGVVAEFADSVRSSGAIPYVILFNDRGYDDHLFQALKPVLASKDIPYYSAHQRFPATNLANFIPDGHFKPEIDIEMTKEIHQHLEKIIEQRN
jgi:hypothetical protein